MKIVYLDSATLAGNDLEFSALEELGNYTDYPNTTPHQIIERTKDAEIIITNKVVIAKETIKSCPKLQYIVVSATGFNNVDIQFAKNQNIPVSNVRGYSTEGVVQHVFSMILSILNKPGYYNDQVTKGRWANNRDFCFYDHSIHELSGKTLGIYGLGTIGNRVAQIGQAFGMNIIAYHRNPDKLIHPPARMVGLNTLFSESDIITLHAPLNKDSEYIINKNSLATMKSNAILINTARGGLVKESDLAEALKKGQIYFAGVDTLSHEPPKKGSPLIGIENCTITPHIAWASFESRERLLEGLVENIKAFQSGKIINQVN